jgi:O-antigen/teichoic acid export membrane protein
LQQKLAAVLGQRGAPGSLRRHLVTSSLGSAAFDASNRAFALVSSILLARLLGPTDYGLYSYVVAIAVLCEILVGLGLRQLLVREVAANLARGAAGKVAGLLRRARQGVFLSSLVFTLVAAAVLWLFGERFEPPLLATFWVALLLPPSIALLRFHEAALRGLGHVLLGQFPEQVLRPFLFLVLFLLAWWLQPTALGSELTMGAQVLSWVLCIAVIAVSLYNRTPSPVKTAAAVYETRDWAGSAVLFMAIGGIQVLMSQVDIVMLGSIEDATAVGIYRPVKGLAPLIEFGQLAVSMAIAPTIARLHAEGDHPRLQHLLTNAARVAMLIALPLALICLFLGGWLLLVFGQQYTVGSTALAILSVGYVTSIALGPVVVILNMSGYARDTITSICIATAVDLALLAILIPLFGLEGAAVATTCGLLTYKLLLAIQAYRKLGLHTTVFGKLW